MEDDPYSFGDGKLILEEGNVQKISFVPAEKLTAASLLELEIIEVLAMLALDPSKVPKPTSNSLVFDELLHNTLY